MPRLLASAFAVTLVLIAIPVFAGPIDISECGQGQTLKGPAVLTRDLDCTGHSFHAVEIVGKLDLNGHTITAGRQRLAVHCLGNCSVVGPGTITSDGGQGIFSRRNLKVKNVTFTGLQTAVYMTDTEGKGRALIQGCTITDVDDGIVAGVPLRMADTVVTGARRTGLAMGTGTVPVHGVVKRSSITGSGTDPLCGVDTSNLGHTGYNCADVLAIAKPPKLQSSTCQTSCSNYMAPACAPWGICSAD